MRPSTDHQRRDLNTMTSALLDQVGKTVFAGLSRVKGPELSKYCSHEDERTIPVDVLLDAEILAGNPMVTRLLAQIQGYELVPIAPAEPVEPVRKATTADVLLAVKEAGDVASAFIAADADGVRDAGERKAIQREIDEAVRALLAVRQGV